MSSSNRRALEVIINCSAHIYSTRSTVSGDNVGWGGHISYIGKHPLRLGNEATSSRQGQALHDHVCDRRMFAGSSEVYGPVSDQTGCTNQSELSVKHEHLRCITTAPAGRRFMNHRIADQVSADIRGTRARGSFSENRRTRRRQNSLMSGVRWPVSPHL